MGKRLLDTWRSLSSEDGKTESDWAYYQREEAKQDSVMNSFGDRNECQEKYRFQVRCKTLESFYTNVDRMFQDWNKDCIRGIFKAMCEYYGNEDYTLGEANDAKNMNQFCLAMWAPFKKIYNIKSGYAAVVNLEEFLGLQWYCSQEDFKEWYNDAQTSVRKALKCA